MPELTEATVVYLVKEGSVCLAQKKQAIHTKDGKELDTSKLTWNGYGGKREKEDESIEHTAVRELFDEAGVKAHVEDLLPRGKLRFFWPGNETEGANMDVYFYFLEKWEGEPQETNEMGEPLFFKFSDIPYEDMMPNDKTFLPKMINGETPHLDVFFGEKDEHGKLLIKETAKK